MSLFSFFFQNTSKKGENNRKNTKIKEIKCENLNIWIEDITKINIEMFSLLNILNKLDLERNEIMKYITKDIIDLDPYRLPYIKFLRIRLKENEKIKRKKIDKFQNLILNVESKLNITNNNIKKTKWVNEEKIQKNVNDFIRNRFYNNYDIKMFLLKHINNKEGRKNQLYINDRNLVIDQSINQFKPNKKVLKKIKGFIVNIKGNQIYLNKVTILRILKQSKIKENKIIKSIIYFTKHIKQNYQIMVKYHKLFTPNKLKKKLYWIKDKEEFNEKLQKINIAKFDELISNTEDYYNMIIEDENRRLREVGLLFPIKRSRSGDIKDQEVLRKFWAKTNKTFHTINSLENYSNSSEDENQNNFEKKKSEYITEKRNNIPVKNQKEYVDENNDNKEDIIKDKDDKVIKMEIQSDSFSAISNNSIKEINKEIKKKKEEEE